MTPRSLFIAAMATLVATPAWAYRTIDDYPDVPDGARVRWLNGVFEYQVYDNPDGSFDADTLSETSQRAFQTWAGAPCSGISPSYAGATDSPAAPGDGVNTIEIVETDWARLGYPDEAAGATDLVYQDQGDDTWTIVEADIYINAEIHRFTTDDPPSGLERSLLGVLVHEGGHALGLLHPCEVEDDGIAPVCDDDALPDAIMSPYYDPAQTFPEEDDYAGVCYLYAGSCGSGCEPGSSCVEGACVPDDEGVAGQSGNSCNGTIDPSTGDCEEAPRRNGMRCTESNQCLGGQCLGGIERGPICTQLCGKGEPACPSGWGCGKVENRNVCVPPSDDTGCSLAAADRSGSSPIAPFAALGAAVLLSLHRRRARRSRTSKEAQCD